MKRGAKVKARIVSLEGMRSVVRQDSLAGEEPLELRVKFKRQLHRLNVTMRTPGHDFELVAGWLLGEGVIQNGSAIKRITYCSQSEQQYNTVNVELHEQTGFNPEDFTRLQASSSACGVCGTGSLEQLERRGLQALNSPARIAAQTLYQLPEKLQRSQGIFASTGGLHAAALFSLEGRLLALREDIGRHNAVDKLIGHAILNKLPLESSTMLVSGRAGFEIVQKCIAARVPILASISAPSSLAVELARAFDLCLIGFLRAQRCNIYHRPERVALPMAG